MKRVKRRLISLFLLIALIITSVFATVSCGRLYDEAEVVAAARELLPKTLMLNSVYYGNGISTINSNYLDGVYYEADPVHLRQLGFGTIEELKKLTLEVFSSRYSASIFENILNPLYSGDVIYRNARYYQAWEDTEAGVERCIMVNTDYDAIYNERMTYNLDQISAVGSEGDAVHMKVGAIVWNEKGDIQKTEITFSLYEEPYGWRIDNPCFANYNEYLDSELLK